MSLSSDHNLIRLDFGPTRADRKSKGGKIVMRLTAEATEIVAQNFEDSPLRKAATTYDDFVTESRRLINIYSVQKKKSVAKGQGAS